MENLNAEKVKIALEVCAEDTPYPDQSQGLLDALALINSQEQRIKELTEENERLKNRVVATVVITDEQLEEIKTECLERVELDIKAIRANAVREFAERAKERFKGDKYNVYTVYNIHRYIDQIAKEMVEGEQ